jgi:hypothetical protein
MARASKRRSKGGTLGRVSEAAAKQKGKAEWLKLEDGDVIQCRVLDTGSNFQDAYVHRVPMERDNESGKGSKTYHADVPCLDQEDTGVPCPGCKDDLERRYKFWTNVIVRGEDDEPDKLMIYSGGITVAKKLDKMDAKHGLDNRDIEIEREGKSMQDTKYDVDWASDANSELSEEDKALAEKKHDLKRYSTPPSYEDFYVPVRDRDREDNVGEKSVARGSAFKRRQQENGDDKKTTSRRSSSKQTSKPPGLSGFGADKSASKTNVRKRRSR